MKATILYSTLTLGLLATASERVLAQATNTLNVYTAVEIVYQTEIGKTYTLQGSIDFSNWTDIGNSVLGHGRLVDQIFSTKNPGSIGYATYRLKITPGPTNGYAPWSLAGAHLQMDDSSSNYVDYSSETNGNDNYSGALDPFSYQYTRLDPNAAQVDRSFTPDRHELLTYTYTAPGVGTWVREEYRQGALERRTLGLFRYLSDVTNNTPGGTNPPVVITGTQPPAPPASLTGMVYYAQSGTVPDKLSFQTLTTGLESPVSIGNNEGEVSPGGNIFTYTYNIQSSNTASLVVNFGYYGFGGDKNEYDLTYTDGPSGTFVRRIYRLGALYSTDNGAFSPYAPGTVSTGNTNNPVVTNTPPSNPAGFTYTVQVDSTPRRLVFQSVNSGIEFDDSSPSTFTYTYQSTGTNAYTMHVQFKPDRWDDYTMIFTTNSGGTIVRKQYRSSVLNRTDSGNFSIAPTTP
ncbi:MAG TPA: hypothetical protein VGE41_10020 [Verrucomicrobiae bacterium]